MPRPKSGKVHFQARVTPEQASAINAYLAGSSLPSNPAPKTTQPKADKPKPVVEVAQLVTPAPNPHIIRTVDDAASILTMRAQRAPLLKSNGKL